MIDRRCCGKPRLISWGARAAALCILPFGLPVIAAMPSVKDAMRLEPTQRDVKIDRPSPDQLGNCTISIQQDNGHAGWLVKAADGLPLRWFADTNGDNVTDRWSYYRNGLEVYRDIDTDFNRQVDQCRWFHSEGTRWGIDQNEDGSIDQWKTISVEEVSAEVVKAIARRDPLRLKPLVLAPTGIESLGVGKTLKERLLLRHKQLLEAVTGVLGKQSEITDGAKWVSFEGGRPGLIPAGTDGSERDVRVYEKAVVIVEDDGSFKQIELGTLIQVGDVWRIIDVPHLASQANSAVANESGLIFQPAVAVSTSQNNPSQDTKYQELLSALAKMDNSAASSQTEQPAAASEQRADILEQLATEAPDPQERAQWTRQLADILAASVQTGDYPQGMTRLDRILANLEERPQLRDLAAYVSFRRLTAAYAVSLQDEKADPKKVHEERVKSLRAFVESYPHSEDAAEAILQLGLSEEFAGREQEAKDWYRKVVDRFGKTTAAEKAAGAIRRLESTGKQVAFRGSDLSGATVDVKDYRGKLVLLHYWATWSPSSTDQIPALADLLKKHGRSGLVVIGINVDSRREEVSEYLANHQVQWPQIHEPGGMDSPPANWFGIFTAPTLILIDREGKIVDDGSDVFELEREIQKRLR